MYNSFPFPAKASSTLAHRSPALPSPESLHSSSPPDPASFHAVTPAGLHPHIPDPPGHQHIIDDLVITPPFTYRCGNTRDWILSGEHSNGATVWISRALPTMRREWTFLPSMHHPGSSPWTFQPWEITTRGLRMWSVLGYFPSTTQSRYNSQPYIPSSRKQKIMRNKFTCTLLSQWCSTTAAQTMASVTSPSLLWPLLWIPWSAGHPVMSPLFDQEGECISKDHVLFFSSSISSSPLWMHIINNYTAGH